jgi:serine phosphatase RsbU (regulator of sigma subunit)/anti-sigma regulatory factor (Ser/Thr protein kinase)
VLIVAPFLWSLRDVRFRIPSPGSVAQALLATALLVASASLVFSTVPPLEFLVIPVLGAIAWRYEHRGGAPAALLVSVIATWAAANDAGTFANENLLEKMVSLQAFNATLALTALFVAAAVAQRQQLAEREHHTVEVLQRSLLPLVPPDVAGTVVAARYLPAGADVQVGGDWYDVVALPGGRLGFAVGDVAGHGVQAAAFMGQLRMALRVYARERLSPADALERLNQLVFDLDPTTIATVWYGQYDPETGGLVFASAGHPPPLLIDEDLQSRFVEELRAPPLGARRHVTYPESSWVLDAGTALLLYTDGLVEARGVPIDAQLDRLRRTVEQGPDDLEELCDHLLHELLDGSRRDDVALLAIRSTSVGARLRLSRPASASAISETRQAVGAWLSHNGVDQVDRFDVLVAASEAFSNVVQHAYGLADGMVEIEGALDRDRVQLSVRDRGRWRPKSVADGRGRGMPIIRALMDSVEVDSDSDGTEVRMTRRLQKPLVPG